MENYNEAGCVNVGCGTDISIKTRKRNNVEARMIFSKIFLYKKQQTNTMLQ